MQPIVMAVLLLAGWGIFAYSAYRRWQLLKIGTPEDRSGRGGERLRAVWVYAIRQLRMRRYPLAGFAHLVIFFGFLVLLLRSLVLWGRGFDPSFDFWVFGTDQPLGKLYSLLKDVFIVLVFVGAVIFIYYRVVARLPRMTLSGEGLLIILIIAVMMVADVLYDGATLVREARAATAASAAPSGEPAAVALHFSGWEPVGSVVQYAVAGASQGGLVYLQHLGFWGHSVLVLLFLNLLPYSKHFHVITAIPNVYLQNLRPPGRLPPIADIEGRLEREETLGIRRIDQFSWKSLLDFYTCTECGRCTDHCPAHHTGKKLSPKHFTIDLRDFLYRHERALVGAHAQGNGQAPADGEPPEHRQDLVDGVIEPEVLWACTTCRACEQECPVFISYVDKIVDLRRYLVQERGEFPNELQMAFRGLESTMNPWSFPAEDRDKWAEGLDVKRIAEHPDVPYLLWVGCMPAFDERAKKVTRAVVHLLQTGGVDFAILGQEEQCTGDPARRAGNEYLFQMFAKANIEILNNYGVDKKTIITICPHCYNTLAHEYGDFGGHYRVLHYTTVLADLVRSGKLRPQNRCDRKVVYHDSCYLGRYNDVYDPPRDALRGIPGLQLVEPAETRDRGMCCGAGGAQMFKEEEHGQARVNVTRTQQLLASGAGTIATACPFCMRMITDGLGDLQQETLPQLDVAEVLWEAVKPAATAPATP
ncbi:MAG TPA: (Fe-S)-binding protein [Phycisphaerae bacterium]|nr:(Fe-S)-binding protein [Phycisphaerae bacterium]HNU47034.1 (Fe-S)-binding protein [Phycisphaerae bacterium]